MPGTGQGFNDPLTGLPSWPLLDDRGAAALRRGERHRWLIAVLVVDIDDFRGLNERLGHRGGDEVLLAAADMLTGLLRWSDTLARAGISMTRFGGDEFVIICEDVVDAAAPGVVADRIRRAFELPLPTRSGPVAVTVSIGAAVADPGSMSFDHLLLVAESAMRAAKASKDGCAHEQPPAAVGLEDQLAAELRFAITENQLRVVYQPKVSLATDKVVGAEALVRWEHPVHGEMPPSEFVPLAEETGLVVPLGNWVLNEACRQSAEWLRHFSGHPPFLLSVNVSAQQLTPDLPGIVRAALEKSGLDASELCLELTESTLMQDVEHALLALTELSALGVQISIDDFGTGYSSLSYFKLLPVDELKIDRSFVDGLGDDPNDTAIVSAIVAMAHALNVSVVAEGVETFDQLERLRNIGCEQAQGYLIARPLQPAAFAAFLSSEASATWRGGDAADHEDTYRPDRVLVVDDTSEVRQLARISLMAAGFDVNEAEDARSAVEAAKRRLPDCVVLDLTMPGLSGHHLCRLLRADPETADCTIVVLTANDRAAAKAEAFSCGADDYMVKPFSPRDLASRVEAAIRRRRQPKPDAE